MKITQTVTNTNNVLSITYSDSHADATAMAVVTAESSTLTLGDSATVKIGYGGTNTEILTGYVKQIDKSYPDGQVVISIYNAMVRAVDYFIASSTPTSTFKRSNISAENLVKDILALAGLTSFNYDPTSFIFAIDHELEVNLVSAYDYCKRISDTLAWHLYCDNSGTVHFVDRKPYPTASDSPVATITDAEILQISKTISDRDLRNRIVVYGLDEIRAEAKASSPYLPSGFYKTVVASAEWIDSTSMAQGAADRNLDLLNRPNIEAQVSIVGDSSLTARQVITLNSSKTGITGNWYIYGIQHTIDKSGFITQLSLRQ